MYSQEVCVLGVLSLVRFYFKTDHEDCEDLEKDDEDTGDDHEEDHYDEEQGSEEASKEVSN